MKMLWLVLFLSPLLSIGQSFDTVKRNDISRVTHAFFKLNTAPLQWKQKDWMKFGGVVLSTAAISAIDMPVRSWAANRKSEFMGNVDRMGDHFGKPHTALGISGGFTLTGLILNNSKIKQTGLILSTGVVTVILAESVLKPLIGRARPGQEEGKYRFSFFNREPGFHSFPSAHASIAFTTSFILAKRTESVPLKIVYYSLAASTAACRIYSDAHWVSDVAFGAMLGWFCSEAVIKIWNTNEYKSIKHKKIKWNVEPYLTGLTVKCSFN